MLKGNPGMLYWILTSLSTYSISEEYEDLLECYQTPGNKVWQYGMTVCNKDPSINNLVHVYLRHLQSSVDQ